MMALRQAEDEKIALQTQQEEWRTQLGPPGYGGYRQPHEQQPP